MIQVGDLVKATVPKSTSVYYAVVTEITNGKYFGMYGKTPFFRSTSIASWAAADMLTLLERNPHDLADVA